MADTTPAAPPSGDWLDNLPTHPGTDPTTEYIQSPATGNWILVPKVPATTPYAPPAPPAPEGPGLLSRAWDAAKAFPGKAYGEFEAEGGLPTALHEGSVGSIGRAIANHPGNPVADAALRTLQRVPFLPQLVHAAADRQGGILPESDEQAARAAAAPTLADTGRAAISDPAAFARQVGSGLKEVAKEAWEHPAEATGAFIHGAMQNPEDFAPVGDLGAAAALSRTARAAQLGATATRAAHALGDVAGKATSFGGLMAGTEAVHELGDDHLDPAKIEQEGAAGAVFGPLVETAMRFAAKPRVAATLDELRSGLDGAGPAGTGEPAKIEGPTAPAGGGGASEMAPSATVAEALKAAREAGVKPADLQPILADAMRGNLKPEETRTQLDALTQAARTEAATKPAEGETQGGKAATKEPLSETESTESETAAPSKVQPASADSEAAGAKLAATPDAKAAGGSPGKAPTESAETAIAASPPKEPAVAPVGGAPTPDEHGVVHTQVAGQAVSVDVQPTELQKASGNYQKGHIDLHGVPITIENPKGTTRSGTAPDGTKWTSTLAHDYGYVKRTVGADRDHIDAIIGEHPESTRVFIVDQHHPEGGGFDEHKVVFGTNSLSEARRTYNANYPKGWEGAKYVAPTTIDGFKDWLASGDTAQAIKGQKLAAPPARSLVGEGKQPGAQVPASAGEQVPAAGAPGTTESRAPAPTDQAPAKEAVATEPAAAPARSGADTAAHPQLSADANERIADPAIRDEMRRMARNAYWDELGGKATYGKDHDTGDEKFAGLTHYIPHEPWFKELAKNERLGKGERSYAEAMEDGFSGKPLLANERRAVERFSELAEQHIKGTLDESHLEEESLAREAEGHAAQLEQGSAHDEYATHLRKIIDEERERESEIDRIAARETEDEPADADQRSPAPGRSEGLDREGTTEAAPSGGGASAGTSPAAPRRPGPVDLFGDDTRGAQELADEIRRRDAARNSGQDSLETGRPDDIFSQARHQVDITDQLGAQSARGTDTGTPAERDREVAEAQDRGGETAVRDERSAEEGGPGRAVSGTPEERGEPHGGSELSGVSPAYGGERGDLEVRAPEARSEPAHAPSGDLFTGRGDEDSGQVAADDARGAPAAFELAAETSPRLPAQHEAKLAAQRAAESIPIERGDAANIAKTLPYLLPQQHEDVHFAEKRLAKPDGAGVLFTNGTGTGKTYVGLGVIKRMVRSGKKNGLVVVPSQKIANDWVRSGKNLGLDIHVLEGLNDPGKGVSITTYANLGENQTLADRPHDFVVADEAHSLMQNAEAAGTGALNKVRALTLHPEGGHTRAQMIHRAEYQPVVAAQAELAQERRLYRRTLPATEAKLRDALAVYEPLEKKVLAQVKATAAEDRPRAVFMSATPFAYEKNVTWAHGYLFDYPKVEESGGYNHAGAYEAFMIQHFGYRMRYGKLTQPGPEVDSALMQRQFNMWMRKQGALAARMLDVDKDYDRKFVLSESKIGTAIDEGLQYLREHEKGKFAGLYSHVTKEFDYLARSRLLEALKAREAVPYIKKQLALGRKVVVFYDYNEGGGTNIFDIAEPEDSGEDSRKLAALVREFRKARPDLVALDTQAHSPLVTLKRAFPQAMEYNGLVSSKKRIGYIDAFNNDDLPLANLVLAQKAANAGWSGHDTTGKHARVLVNLGLPTAPTVAIQQEGRIYRVGQASDAMFRYFNTGTNWERSAFASTIANRASTAENLAMGEQARGLRDAFIEAFENSGPDTPGAPTDGKGGKTRDRALVEATSDFDKARSFYYGQQKKNARTKAQEGTDYFATPEPLGLKMVEWAGIRPTDQLLEPSAGHGAIARWFPEHNTRTMIEPSLELSSRLALVTDGKILQERFEDLHAVNKYDAIVMNPPFGSGGKTAIDHLSLAFSHLRDGGRVVALIPEGPAADAKFDKWFEATAGVHKVAEFGLPTIAFERAGTKVKARVVVLDKLTKEAGDAGASLGDQYSRREIEGETVPAFFANIKDREAPGRVRMPEQKSATPAEELADAGLTPRGSAAATPAGTALFQTFDATHTRTGEPAFYASPTQRVDRAGYDRWNAAAKKSGGYYSSFRAAGTKPGFIFKSAEARSEFLQAIERMETERPTLRARLRRGAGAEGEADPDVAQYLERVSQALEGYARVAVHENPKAFGEAIDQDVPSDIYGAYTSDDQTLHFIASNLRSVEAAQAIFRHEGFGHLAMERSPDFQKALAMVDRLRRMGGGTFKALWKEVGLRNPGADDTTLRKEVIATMAERGVKNAVLDRAITGALEILRKVGISAPDHEAELRQMIVQAARGLPPDALKIAGADRAAAYQVENALQAGREGDAQDAMARVLPESEALDALAQAKQDGDAQAIEVLKELSSDAALDAPPGAGEPTIRDAYHPAEASVPQGVLYARHAPMDPAAEATRDRVMPKDGRTNLSLRDRIRLSLKALSNVDTLAVRQHWVDDLSSIENYERMLNGGKLLEGAVSPLKAGRSIRNLASQMAAVLEKGIPVHSNGAMSVVPGRKGLKEVFAPLHTNPDGSLVTHFELYSAARRASRLITEKNRDGTLREKTFTPADIKAGLDIAKRYPEVQQVFDDLQKVWKQLLDLGQAAGTINPAARAIYERHGDYVPFYRLDDMAGGENPSRPRGGIANQREMSGRLTGKAAPLGNIIENIMMNIANQVDAAQKNLAAQRIVDQFDGVFANKEPKAIEAVKISNEQIERAMKAIGLDFDPQMTPAQRDAWTTFFHRVAPTDKDIIRVMRDGKPEYWRISDPLVLEAMTALQGAPKWLRDADKKMFGLLSGPKRLYTALATAMPMYTARRFIRVMMDTWMQSNEKLGLAKNAFRDFYDAINGHKDLYDMMMAGSGGAQGYDADPERVRDLMIKGFKGGNKQNFVLKAANPKTWWDTWRKIQGASKNEHMLRVYRAARAKGSSVAEAAFRARDIEDLSMHGGGWAMQIINRSVPFLNARVQGTYRMFRGYKDNWKSYMIRGMAVAMGSLGLAAVNMANPQYLELPQWEKDMAWHVFIGNHHFIIPKPFELGLIYGTLPERLLASAYHAAGVKGGDTVAQSMDALKRAVLDTFALNPIPQFARPALEQAMNTDEFGNTIVPDSLKAVRPQEQYTPYTSTTVRDVAGAMPGQYNYVLNSPARLQALVESVTGPMGMSFLAGADRLTRRGLGYGDAPALPILKNVAASFYKNGEPTSTKYTAELYDFLDQADRTYASVTHAMQDGQMERARTLVNDNRQILSVRTTLNQLGKEMREVGKAEAAISHSRSMDADQKEAALEKLTKMRNDLARQVAPFEDMF